MTINNHNQHKLPSERSFGLLFVVVFAALAGYAYYKNLDINMVIGAAAVSVLLIPISFFIPVILRPFNWVWYWLGQIMGKIVNPIVLGIIFFLLLTPVGVMGRLFGRDTLKLKRRQVDSYWIERDPIGPAPETFKNQY